MPLLIDVQSAVAKSIRGHPESALPLVASSGLSAESRLRVYRNNFVLALTNALKLGFPAVLALVGDGFFESAAQVFIAAHPPISPCLDEYGADFSGWLRDYQPAASVPYLADVAALEWALSIAALASDTAPLALSRLATAKFALPRTPRIFSCASPIPPMRSAPAPWREMSACLAPSIYRTGRINSLLCALRTTSQSSASIGWRPPFSKR